MSQNYKDTLHLPKTDFPMKADLVKREPERLRKWDENGLYRRIQESRKDAPLFVLHDGPPFANGDVHMGTALNKVLKDLIVKSRTMLGFRAPYVPGWDCHGLPIEFKVVKESRGLSPVEVRTKSEEYARKFVDIQRTQFKRLGVLGEWENPYLTLAPEYEAEIIRAFATFVDKGLVYQSKKPVYWSTGAQTALAEAEVEYAERVDPAIFVKFPIVSGELAGKASMVIWTTTPWTLPANVAIAVSPRASYVVAEFRHAETGATEQLVMADDEALLTAFAQQTGWTLAKQELSRAEAEQWSAKRKAAGLNWETGDRGGELLTCIDGYALPGSELAGSEAQHPFLDRTSRVISADFVTMDTGTGQVHVAPGHGADDYVAGKQNDLPILSPVDDRGCLTEDAGVPELTGQYVFKANPLVIEILRGRGALLGADLNYKHDYPHCWRSKTPIVFRAVEQFFIRIDDIRADALAAIESVDWLPHWGRARIHGTVESRPDWCISRQRTWGVPLPVFYTAEGKAILESAIAVPLARQVADLFEKEGTNLWFEKDDAWWAQTLGLPEGTTRRNDTLDVWIDSGVSHTAVTAKRPELGGSTVADVYLEATDQHRGWFQSSLMTSIAMYGRAPYKTVITHGFVVDKDTRKKVSKSEQGTYKKPMNAEHFVGKYGADIVRLWASSVEFTNEVPFSEESFAVLTDAYRSFRNVLRILLANCGDFDRAQHAVDLVASGEAGGITLCTRTGAPIAGTAVDRWMLSRLQEVAGTCREAYAEYDFRKVFQTLNQFVTVEISALYVDITKDRLYCDAVDSPRRRATQTVMLRVFETLAKLLAPILAFTADEAWEHAGKADSIHLEHFPEADAALRDTALEMHIDKLLKLRALVAQAVEPARQEKLIGNALEGSVALQIGDETLFNELKDHEVELEEFFILSELTLIASDETSARIVRTAHAKCARCWRHRPTVGESAAHPELCERCATVVTATA
ncbi:MAG: isoleucyl-tRNA synthetase [Chthoniobacter sp.]|nr:isoleucyl-tRNA synthetase [Chthoniobacter sp.]